MASVLTASGFKNLESLQDFANRFPNVSVCLNSSLEKIWVCHKNSKDIPAYEDINLLPCEDYYYLSKKIRKKIAAGKDFYSLLTEFSAFSVFNEIYSQFKEQLTTYLFTKCFLFYNWGINAFEPLIDHFEIHSKILNRPKKSYTTEQKIAKCNFFNYMKTFENKELNYESKEKERSFDLFEEQLNFFKCKSTKLVNFRSITETFKKGEKFYDIFRNSNNSYQETFSLKKILYDLKQRPQWPRRHVLSRRNVEDLILFIVRIPVVTDRFIENNLLNEHKNWFGLRELLKRFIKNHEVICMNGGFERILKKHLKIVKTVQCKGLNSVPKSSVCSYLLDILRKVLPLELFGGSHIRKNFFSGLLKVVNGSKNETFIWYPLLRLLLVKKSDVQWCAELGDHYTQSQVILKLFKFIVLHYVFIILKKNFYITETSSSGFGLKFYRKSDMERASTACLNSLLQNGNVKRLDTKDYVPTVERNWLKTGNITVQDLLKKLKKTEDSHSEYKQPVAHVRFLPKSEGSDELRVITYIIRRGSKYCKGTSSIKRLENHFKSRLLRRKKTLLFVKLFLEYLVKKVGSGIRPLPCNPELERAWKKIVHLKEKYGKLFFVKADISDAFDSVKYNALTQILRCAFENEAELGQVKLIKIIEWKKRNRKIQKVARLCFGNAPKENSVVINRSVVLPHNEKIKWYLRVKFLEIIKQVVMQQELEINGKIFKLTKGLAQGSAGRFSTQLCEIYYSSMDDLFFRKFIHSNDSVFLRGVDDYLFVTCDVEKARTFLEIVQRGFVDYNVRFKSLKLKSNLIENIHEVLYLGLVFNFENMSVSPNYSIYRQRDILSTINPIDRWGHKHFKKELFLHERLSHITCLKLHPIVVKGYHNLKTMRQMIFEACLMQSLRVLTLSNYLYSGGIKDDFAVYQTLLMSCSKIKKVVTSCGVSTIEVNWLFFFAALNIVRKYTGQFKVLFLMIRFQLQKFEKEFHHKGTELLLCFLKEDVIDAEYWKKVSEAFKELGKIPLKVS